MNILIGTSPFCCRDKTVSLLQQAGITPSTTLDLVDEQTLSQATVLLANHSVAAAIVLYAPLDMALEHAIAQSVPVEQALVSWQQNTSQLVRFYKQHRTGVLLASLADVFAAPQAFVNACANRWPSLTLDDNEPVSSEVKPAPFYQLLAYALQIHVPALQTLSQQLTALTQPLTYHHPAPTSLPVDVGELVSHYQHAVSAQKQLPALMEQLYTLQQECEQGKQKLDEQQQENQLLLEQLFSVQEELDSRLQEHEKQRTYQQQQQTLTQQLEKKQQAHVKEKQELQNQNARLQEQWNSLQQEYEQEKQRQDELRQENQLLLEQLFAVQEELESHYLASRQQDSQQQPGSSSSDDQHTHNANVPLLKRQLQKWTTKKALRRKLADLHNSPLFDPKWYLAQYPDIATNVKFRKNPALHYLKFGGFEGRNPSPHFNSAAYLALNPDVQAEGFNPLLHYLRFGQAENRHTGQS
ncbi:hypothetical protein [Oceanisphaera psychrotolerans]|uniref:Uncharacterized protein n=1 Tax=Oceanisphaera psychrotolerans TaxID=1414654 RepID=A0A1J4QFM4_9GAMM|nr:hypothetical protein [Oceanisphaera psychrotolerans]OIN12892.1 hypothetical protein BFR47_10930 [Oceanisphaera psychrotolerans]